MSSSADTQLLSNADFIESPSHDDRVAQRDDLVGSKLSNYVVDRVLGEGGMGRVYLAHHSRISQKCVAIKVLHPEFAGNPQMIGRFRREAETAFAISHPNVVTILDIDCTPSGLPYLVYEYLEGIDLSEHLDKVGKLSVQEALHIGRQICRGVMAAHARGVIHRDLKPANVFLIGTFAKDAPERQCAKVLDFGLSRFLEPAENDQLTQQGLIMGTPAYMPPEQARAQTVDHRADIYGVGAILYTALTGHAPFETESPQATLVAVMTSDPPRPRSYVSSIPPHLELVIERAMAKEPADRYPDMSALEEALEAVSASLTSAGEAIVPRVALPSIDWRDTDADDVRTARLRLVLNGVAAVLLLIFAMTTAIRGVELASGHIFDAIELRLCLLVIVATVLPPAIVWIMRVRRNIWDNSSRVLVLLGLVRAALLAFIVTYGVGVLVLHGVDDFFVRLIGGGIVPPMGVNWPGWDLLLPIMGLVAASTATMRRRVTAGMKPGWRRSLVTAAMLALALAALGSITHLGIRWHARTPGADRLSTGAADRSPP